MQQQPHSIKLTHPIRLIKPKDNIYSKVNNEKRVRLLHLVKEKGKSLKEAAQLLDINYSTAKTILRIYRIEKRILKKSSSILNSHSGDSDFPIADRQDQPLLLGLSSQASSVETNYSGESPSKAKTYGDYAMGSNAYVIQLQNLVRMTQECVEQVIMNEMIISNIANSLGQLSQGSFLQGGNGYNSVGNGFSNCINYPLTMGGGSDLQ